jgi:biopolymer transport protein ExbD
MKLATSKKIHYDSGPNMTPMVDVVMVILVFLMLSGTFVGIEHYLVSNLPYTKSGGGNAAPPPGGFPDDVPLEIRVDPNATRDGFIARVGQYQARTEQQLVAQLGQMREKFAIELGKTPDQIQVKINPGGSVKYEYIVQVYQAALQARFTKIGFTPAR